MKTAMICFTRIPIPGQTKQRLMPLLGGENCAKLHTAFLRDIAVVCAQVDAVLFVAHTPGQGAEILQDIFPDRSRYFPQAGQGLGERMHQAISAVLRMGFDACVLIGADIPQLTAAHLEQAFCALEQADMTLGPTADGGYYLIGLRSPCAGLFQGQRYSTSSVYQDTLAAAQKAGLRVCPAPPCDDIDTPEDLHRFWQDHQETDSHTMRCLREIAASGVKL